MGQRSLRVTLMSIEPVTPDRLAGRGLLPVRLCELPSSLFGGRRVAAGGGGWSGGGRRKRGAAAATGGGGVSGKVGSICS